MEQGTDAPLGGKHLQQHPPAVPGEILQPAGAGRGWARGSGSEGIIGDEGKAKGQPGAPHREQLSRVHRWVLEFTHPPPRAAPFVAHMEALTSDNLEMIRMDPQRSTRSLTHKSKHCLNTTTCLPVILFSFSKNFYFSLSS